MFLSMRTLLISTLVEVNTEPTNDTPGTYLLTHSGVLTGGCVQEEILFVIKPECLVSLLICSVMKDNESIIISGLVI